MLILHDMLPFPSVHPELQKRDQKEAISPKQTYNRIYLRITHKIDTVATQTYKNGSSLQGATFPHDYGRREN
jgi:hypothetical protein